MGQFEVDMLSGGVIYVLLIFAAHGLALTFSVGQNSALRLLPDLSARKPACSTKIVIPWRRQPLTYFWLLLTIHGSAAEAKSSERRKHKGELTEVDDRSELANASASKDTVQ